ncbi:MAG: ABC transporter ATP-binding protein [Bacillota bacterium]|nr:ABC transporter ATP-binding protein [Bacillota bacterium]
MNLTDALVIKNLTKKYPKVEALKGLDLTLSKGQICGLLGPNGSGKSTLLKSVVGLIKPDNGSIEIFGKSPSRYTKAMIAFVPEIDSLYRWMTIDQTIKFISSFYDDWEVERERELLDFMRLERDKKVSSLSKGMRARLKLILALARTAPLILLDEPFSGIDPASRDRIVEGIIRQFKSEDQTMIISTHSLGDTEQLFDSVIFLDEGIISLQGNAEDLRLQHGKSINDLFKEVFA